MAASLQSLDVGKIIVISPEGDVLSPGHVRRHHVLGVAALGVLTGAVATAVTLLSGAWAAGVAAGVAYLGLLGWRSRPGFAIRRALALLANHRHEAAEAMFGRLEAGRVRPATQRIIDFYMGQIAWHFGRFDEADQRYERAIAGFDKYHPQESGMYWLCAFERVQLAAARGDVERAEELAAEFDSAPRGEYFRVERLFADLLIRFHRGTSTESTEELYDAARMALESNCYGRLLAALAWNFAEQGDRDMAEHLLREAPERMKGDNLAQAIPGLHAWMRAELANLADPEWP